MKAQCRAGRMGVKCGGMEKKLHKFAFEYMYTGNPKKECAGRRISQHSYHFCACVYYDKYETAI